MENNRCLNLALRQSDRLVTRFYDEKFAQLGLRGGQFAVLQTVRSCKVTNNGELQRLLVIDQSTLSRNLKPLFRDGLLTLTPDQDDQRLKHISLSAAGESLYQQALPLWQEAQQALSEQLGQDEAAQIINTSTVVVKALG